jgi:hypothetical protein
MYCTPKNIDGYDKLWCQYCDYEAEEWRVLKKVVVPYCEIEAMECIKEAQLDMAVACQVRLPFWKGCLDFVHLPTKTVFQVDGSSHFKGVRTSSTQQQLVVDIRCCKQAWQHGMRLVRIHHGCRDILPVIEAGVKLQATSFVMLTCRYNNVTVKHNKKKQAYVDWVADQLSAATKHPRTQHGCIVFM